MGKERSGALGWSGKHAKDVEYVWSDARLVLTGGAVLVNALCLVPIVMVQVSAADHARVLTQRFARECVEAVPAGPDLPSAFATVRFERPHLLRLTWNDVSDLDAVVLCEYDLEGDGAEVERVVRAWMEER